MVIQRRLIARIMALRTELRDRDRPTPEPHPDFPQLQHRFSKTLGPAAGTSDSPEPTPAPSSSTKDPSTRPSSGAALEFITSIPRTQPPQLQHLPAKDPFLVRRTRKGHEVLLWLKAANVRTTLTIPSAFASGLLPPYPLH